MTVEEKIQEMTKLPDDLPITTQVVINFIRSEREQTKPIFGIRVDRVMKEGRRTILNYRGGGGAQSFSDPDSMFPDPSPDDALKKVN